MNPQLNHSIDERSDQPVEPHVQPSVETIAAAPILAPAARTSPVRKYRRKKRISIVLIFSVAWLAMVVGLALLQPFLHLPKYNRSDYGAIAARPGTPGHLLGTDEIGRDMLSRLIVGGRVSLSVGIGALIIATLLGGSLGLIGGFFGGIVNRIIGAFVDVALAFPALIALIALSVFLGTSLRTIIIGIGIVGSPAMSRVARAATLTFVNRDFVTAARQTGASSWRVLRREVLPNVVVPVLSYGIIFAGVAIIAEGGLSFLGLGVPPPASSWGSMMGGGRNQLAVSPHIVLIPAVTMFVTLVSLNFVGDQLGKRFDIRESSL